MALTDVVEAAGGQALGQMCGEQKAGEKSQRDVVVVKNVGLILCAAFSFTQKHLQEEIQLVDMNEFKF